MIGSSVGPQTGVFLRVSRATIATANSAMPNAAPHPLAWRSSIDHMSATQSQSCMINAPQLRKKLATHAHAIE